MTSLPPSMRSSSVPPVGAVVDLPRTPAPRDDSAVCFAVEGEPPGTSEIIELGGGSLDIRTRLSGRILSVMDDVIEIDHDGWIARIRCLLPSELSLEPLAGLKVEAQITLTLPRRGRPVIDAVLRDLDGALVLWARDGALPSDRESQAVAVRITQSPEGAPQLVLAAPRAMVRLTEGQAAELPLGEERARALALRVSADEASFVLVRT